MTQKTTGASAHGKMTKSRQWLWMARQTQTRGNPSGEGLESEQQQGGTANLQNRLNLPPSHERTDKHTRFMSAKEAVQWADQLQAQRESREEALQREERQAATAAFQGESRMSTITRPNRHTVPTHAWKGKGTVGRSVSSTRRIGKHTEENK